MLGTDPTSKHCTKQSGSNYVLYMTKQFVQFVWQILILLADRNTAGGKEDAHFGDVDGEKKIRTNKQQEEYK